MRADRFGPGGQPGWPGGGQGGGVGLLGQALQRQLGQLEVVSGLGQLGLGAGVVQRGDKIAGLHLVAGPHVHRQQPAAGFERQGQCRVHSLKDTIGQDRYTWSHWPR